MARPKDPISRWRGGKLRIYARRVERRKVKDEEVGGRKRAVTVPELVTEYLMTADAVPYGHGLALALRDPGHSGRSRRLSTKLDSGLWLDIEVRNGRPQPVGLRSDPDGPELTPQALRFALDEEAGELIVGNTVRLELDKEGRLIGVPLASSESPVEQRTVAEREETAEEWYARPKRKRGRPPLSPEHLREVLEVAENAIAQKRPATNAIVERWTVAPATARQWLYKARKARAGKEK